MDKAQMDKENEELNYVSSWDICFTCGDYRNQHDKDSTHVFSSNKETVELHEFVNIPGKIACGECGFTKDYVTHKLAPGKETYRKPIYTRYDLIPPIALHALARVYAEGAEVYGDSKYISSPMPHSNVVNHLINHLNLAQCGDRTEDHWAKVAWAAFTMIVYEKLGIGEADLANYGVVSKRKLYER